MLLPEAVCFDWDGDLLTVESGTVVFCSLKQALSESKVAWATRIDLGGGRYWSVVLGDQLCWHPWCKMAFKIMKISSNIVQMLATICNRHDKAQESFLWCCSCHRGNESIAHCCLPQGLAAMITRTEKSLYLAEHLVLLWEEVLSSRVNRKLW